MPEPEIQIIKGICTPYSKNPEGIGLVLNNDLTGDTWIRAINMGKNEIEFESKNTSYRNFKEKVDIFDLLPSARRSIYTKKFDVLNDKNIVYIDFKKSGQIIVDDERDIFYSNVGFGSRFFFEKKNRGIDIVDGGYSSLIFDNIDNNLRGIFYTLNARYGAMWIVWSSDEFPYTNMTILMNTSFPKAEVQNYALRYVHTRDGKYRENHIVKACIKSEEINKQFFVEKYDQSKEKVIMCKTPFYIPLFEYKGKNLLKNVSDLILDKFIHIAFMHHQEIFPQDQKQILIIDYDAYRAKKEEDVFKFFDLNDLRWKEGDEVHHNVTDLSQIKLNPECVAKSSKITLYAFNGQSPFPGKAELVVK